MIELSRCVKDSRVDILKNALAFDPGFAVARGGFARVRKVALILDVQSLGLAKPGSAIGTVTSPPLPDRQPGRIPARDEDQRPVLQWTGDKSPERLGAVDVLPLAGMTHQVCQRMKPRQLVKRSTAAEKITTSGHELRIGLCAEVAHGRPIRGEDLVPPCFAKNGDHKARRVLLDQPIDGSDQRGLSDNFRPEPDMSPTWQAGNGAITQVLHRIPLQVFPRDDPSQFSSEALAPRLATGGRPHL